jgi:hypothetical protein
VILTTSYLARAKNTDIAHFINPIFHLVEDRHHHRHTETALATRIYVAANRATSPSHNSCLQLSSGQQPPAHHLGTNSLLLTTSCPQLHHR